MHALRVVVACVAVSSIGLTALAQPAGGGGAKPSGQQPAGREGGRGGPQGGGGAGGREQPRGLSPEKAKAAWELQATGVAKHLGLSDAESAALVKAYTDARTSHEAASEKLRKELREKAQKEGGDDEGGGGRRAMGAEMLKATEEMNTAERAKFQKALSGSLNEDQTSKAMASLGGFNRQWDNMADMVAGFNLEGAKKQEALNAMESFFVEQGKLRARLREAGGGSGGDGAGGGGRGEGGAGAAMQEARTKLQDSMKKILSEEQFTKFEESMRGGGRGMGRGRGGDGGEGGGGDGNGQPPRRGRGGAGGGGG